MRVPTLKRVSLPSRPGIESDDVTVVSLRGEQDIQDARALRACLGDIRWHGRPRSIIDLTRLAFIDCACLGVLVWHACEIRVQGGPVELAGPQGAVRRILLGTGLLTGFEVHDTIWQAAGADRACRSDFPAANPQSRESRKEETHEHPEEDQAQGPDGQGKDQEEHRPNHRKPAAEG